MRSPREYWDSFWSLDTIWFMAAYFGTLFILAKLGVHGAWWVLALPAIFVVDLTRRIAWELFKIWRTGR